jgi:hypothetical protein
MYRRNKARAFFRVELPPRQPSEPARPSRTDVQDAGALGLEHLPQQADLEQRSWTFVMHWHRYVADACGFQLWHHAPPVGDHNDLVPLLNKKPTNLQSATFDAAGVQFGKNLDDFHWVHNACANRLNASHECQDAYAARTGKAQTLDELHFLCNDCD